MYFLRVQFNTTFPIFKYINSSLIRPTAGDIPVRSTNFSSVIISALTLSCKGEEILLSVFKTTNWNFDIFPWAFIYRRCVLWNFFIYFHFNKRFIESRFVFFWQELWRNFIEIYWDYLFKSDIWKCRETVFLDNFIESELSARSIDVW